MKNTCKLADKLLISLSWGKKASVFPAVFFLYFHTTTAFTVLLTPDVWAFSSHQVIL